MSENLMVDPFYSSKYSIAHAKRRISELEKDIALFLESDPYTRHVYTDLQRGKDVHKIRLAKPMPVPVPGTAFDALNNLRSALDQAGYTIATAKDPVKGKKAHFPFGDTFEEANSRKLGGSRDIPESIFDYMMSFQPYRGGKGLLWALNKMCNANKHEVITPLIVANTGVNLGEPVDEVEVPGGCVAGASSLLGWSGGVVVMPLSSINDEIEVFAVTSEQGSKYDLGLRFFVGVTKIDVVNGKPIGDLLNEFSSIAENVVLGVETESYRLGLIK